MVLSVPGGEDVYLTSRNLTLDVDGEKMEWEDPTGQDQQEVEQVVGRLLQVDIGRSRLRRIASASRVSGTIGGIKFRLTDSHKRKISSLLAMPQKSTFSSGTTGSTL